MEALGKGLRVGKGLARYLHVGSGTRDRLDQSMTQPYEGHGFHVKVIGPRILLQAFLCITIASRSTIISYL